MKKIILLGAIALLSTSLFAQLGNSNVFPSTGFAGIGTKLPTEALQIHSGTIRLDQYIGTEARVLTIDSTGKIVPGMPVSAIKIPDGLGGVSAISADQPIPGVFPYWSLTGNNVAGTYTRASTTRVGDVETVPVAELGIAQSMDINFYTNSRYNVIMSLLAGTGGLRINGITNINNTLNVTKDVGFASKLNVAKDVTLSANLAVLNDATVNRLSIGGANFGSNASTKLAVEGLIYAREIKVLASGLTPDYVFEKDYKLSSLKELEQYIVENKHLPGIPSACEVQENQGVELGEMNRLLLEKVEELTLYLIKQQKEIDQLKSQKADK